VLTANTGRDLFAHRLALVASDATAACAPCSRVARRGETPRDAWHGVVEPGNKRMAPSIDRPEGVEAWRRRAPTISPGVVAGRRDRWHALESGPRRKVLLPTYASAKPLLPRAADSPSRTRGICSGMGSAAAWRSPSRARGARGFARRPTPRASCRRPLDALAAAYAAVALRGRDLATVEGRHARRRLAALRPPVRKGARGRRQRARERPQRALSRSARRDRVDPRRGRGSATCSTAARRRSTCSSRAGPWIRCRRSHERSPFARALADWTRAAFAAATREGEAPRIVEIGAGTAATTAHLLPLLPPGARYLFTDVSRAFLDRATTRFGTQPGFSTALLDIEAPSRDPGAEGANDVAIAVNVLHATREPAARRSRRSAHCCAPEACSLLGEITAAPGWLDLVFGLLDGWWRFDDAPLRTESALLPAGRCASCSPPPGSTRSPRSPTTIARASSSRAPACRKRKRLVLGAGPLAIAVRDALAAEPA
jgi:SAM-dependent methyltransferase